MYNYLLLLLLLALVALIFFGVWESRTREIRKAEAEEEIKRLHRRQDRLVTQLTITKSEAGKARLRQDIRKTADEIANQYRSLL